MQSHPTRLMILVAGPYRSGTGDDPAKLAANVAAMEAFAMPLFRAGPPRCVSGLRRGERSVRQRARHIPRGATTPRSRHRPVLPLHSPRRHLVDTRSRVGQAISGRCDAPERAAVRTAPGHFGRLRKYLLEFSPPSRARGARAPSAAARRLFAGGGHAVAGSGTLMAVP